MHYMQQQLDNGLTVQADLNPNAQSMAIGFFVRTGARDEPTEIGGVSHFLEHMVFKGTATRSPEDVNRQLDEMGSHSNARTGEDSTIYHSAVLPDFQTPIVELLADIMQPSLRDEDFEMEKQVIIEEIMMYDDQPPYGGYERIMSEFFGEHPLAQSVLGTVETVGNMTAEQMRQYYKERYSPDNICVAIAGKVDYDRLIRDLERTCGHWEPHRCIRQPRPAHTRKGFVVIDKAQSTQEYILQLTQGPSGNDQDRYAARLLTAILGDDCGSRMFWEFLDTGLADGAGMGTYEYDDAGVIMTYLSCQPDQAEENLERLQILQERILSQPVTARELELAKSKIASQIILASERTNSRMFSVGTQWLRNHTFKTPAEIAAIYDSITLEQIRAVAAKYDLTKNMTVVVGPKQDWSVT
ncbi:MAG TPA: pitrilysin family protein [Pirellulaceae bacterium]|nr:pitrilysin family protein [Pirellulaceae bacterium]HMO92180.1 pitrilysin family protein [Pirellulaceae bacterium]HMP68893.1 pitrilysin family protein [Pirellulaceae bacterium]